MKQVLMTGATGLVGNQLGQLLFKNGFQVKVVSRSKTKALQQLSFPAEIIECDLNSSELPGKAFENVTHVIHLAGETIDGRWTEEKKQAILNSRVLSTINLLKNIPDHVEAVISTSAQGIYKPDAEQVLTESSQIGDGFLADVCKQWEAPVLELQNSNRIRTVIFRVGVVLSHKGGALKKMIPLFQKNLGAALGDGQQWMSWIHLDDLCQMFLSAITNSDFRGVYNAVTENPVKNQEFTDIFCQQIDSIQLPRVPEVGLKLLYGEMASIILDSLRLSPENLLKHSFQFQYPNLTDALAQELSEFKNGQGFFTAQQYVPYSIEKVFDFFSDAKNLEKITPDLLHFKIKDMSTEVIQKDTLINYSLKIHGVPASWRTHIESWNPPYQFVDNQLKGPYKKWHHTHVFEKMGDGTLISDFVRFELPVGFVGRLVAGSLVQKDVETIFSYRRQVIADQVF